jgi:hypothetical protein
MSGSAIMLSTGRKGTFLVLTALTSRVDVRVYDQVLGPEYLPGATGKEVLAHVFDRSGGEHVRATILPVAWFNARDHYPGFWEELRRRNVLVMHLHRRNLLRRYVSLQVARTSNEWIAHEHTTGQAVVAIDPVECRRFVEYELESDRAAADFFADHDVLDLYYEEIVRDYDRQLARVQRFLGLAPQHLRPTSHKQGRKPLSEVVMNYQELRDYWVSTPWPEWLTEERDPAVEPAGPEQARGALVQ